jgi:ribonuclease HII
MSIVIASAGSKALAGPVILLAIHFLEPIPDLPGIVCRREGKRYLAKARHAALYPQIASINRIESVQSFEPDEVDEVGCLQLYSDHMERLCYYVAAEAGIPTSDIVACLTDNELPGSTFIKSYRDTSSNEAIVAGMIAFEYFRKRVHIYAERYPQYGWASNSGMPSREHMLAIMKDGLVPGIHRLSTRKTLASWLLKQLCDQKEDCKDYYRYFRKDPKWWKRLFGSNPGFNFTSHLPARERQILDVMTVFLNPNHQISSYPDEFLYTWLEMAPEGVLSAEGEQKLKELRERYGGEGKT